MKTTRTISKLRDWQFHSSSGINVNIAGKSPLPQGREVSDQNLTQLYASTISNEGLSSLVRHHQEFTLTNTVASAQLAIVDAGPAIPIPCHLSVL